MLKKTELDDYGNPILDSWMKKKNKNSCNLPLIGAAR